MLQDHPRGCGENAASTASMLAASGSPPRMRGKLLKSAENLLTNRITPADAGKTDAPAQVALENEDHPRGCGENRPRVYRGCARVGSPPRMRGKLRTPIGVVHMRRITPADAGKTQAQQMGFKS